MIDSHHKRWSMDTTLQICIIFKMVVRSWRRALDIVVLLIALSSITLEAPTQIKVNEAELPVTPINQTYDITNKIIYPKLSDLYPNIENLGTSPSDEVSSTPKKPIDNNSTVKTSKLITQTSRNEQDQVLGSSQPVKKQVSTEQNKQSSTSPINQDQHTQDFSLEDNSSFKDRNATLEQRQHNGTTFGHKKSEPIQSVNYSRLEQLKKQNPKEFISVATMTNRKDNAFKNVLAPISPQDREKLMREIEKDHQNHQQSNNKQALNETQTQRSTENKEKDIQKNEPSDNDIEEKVTERNQTAQTPKLEKSSVYNVSEENKDEKVFKESTAETVPKQSNVTTVPKESTAETVPTKSTAETLPKESNVTTVPKESTAETLPKESNVTTVFKESQVETMQKESKIETEIQGNASISLQHPYKQPQSVLVKESEQVQTGHNESFAKIVPTSADKQRLSQTVTQKPSKRQPVASNTQPKQQPQKIVQAQDQKAGETNKKEEQKRTEQSQRDQTKIKEQELRKQIQQEQKAHKLKVEEQEREQQRNRQEEQKQQERIRQQEEEQERKRQQEEEQERKREQEEEEREEELKRKQEQQRRRKQRTTRRKQEQEDKKKRQDIKIFDEERQKKDHLMQITDLKREELKKKHQEEKKAEQQKTIKEQKQLAQQRIKESQEKRHKMAELQDELKQAILSRESAKGQSSQSSVVNEEVKDWLSKNSAVKQAQTSQGESENKKGQQKQHLQKILQRGKDSSEPKVPENGGGSMFLQVLAVVVVIFLVLMILFRKCAGLSNNKQYTNDYEERVTLPSDDFEI